MSLVLFKLEKLCKSSKSKDFLKFRKKIIIINPIQNSNPANANKKKEVEVKIKSSLITPVIVV